MTENEQREFAFAELWQETLGNTELLEKLEPLGARFRELIKAFAEEAFKEGWKESQDYYRRSTRFEIHDDKSGAPIVDMSLHELSMLNKLSGIGNDLSLICSLGNGFYKGEDE